MNSAKTASVKSVTTNTKILDAKRIETAELLVDGISISEVVPKWKPREHIYRCVLEEDDDFIIYDDEGNFLDCKLEKLENGANLFQYGKGLEEFSFSLPSLTTGNNMFANCNLGTKAVESILRTIPEYSEGSHPLTMNMSATAFEKFNEITGNERIGAGTIMYKGWNVTSNAVITLPLEELTTSVETLLGEGKVTFDVDSNRNKLIVHTDRVDDAQVEAVNEFLESALPASIEMENYNHHIEVSWRDINKYAACTTVAEMAVVNPDYKNDLPSDGEWVYPLPELTSTGPYPNNLFTEAYNVRKVKMYLPKAMDVNRVVHCDRAKSALEELDVEAPIVDTNNYGGIAHIIQGLVQPKKIRIVLPKQRYIDQLFWNSYKYTPEKVEVIVPMMQSAEYGFTHFAFTKENAMPLFNQLRTFTSGKHLFDILLTSECKDDPEILEAISVAESKGWTLTVNFYPSGDSYVTPTSTTYGMRKPTIYAKLDEVDGKPYLHTCHYATDPTGYEEFGSVEEAREYFGIEEEAADV